MFEKYSEYIKDNPRNLWFKRRPFGWGWVPVKREGWLVVIAFILFVLLNSYIIGLSPAPTDRDLFWFFVRLGAAVAVLLWICFKKGEKPRWQWGYPKNDE